MCVLKKIIIITFFNAVNYYPMYPTKEIQVFKNYPCQIDSRMNALYSFFFIKCILIQTVSTDISNIY